MSSFDFSWKSSEKPAGKVFARKKKQVDAATNKKTTAPKTEHKATDKSPIFKLTANKNPVDSVKKITPKETVIKTSVQKFGNKNEGLDPQKAKTINFNPVVQEKSPDPPQSTFVKRKQKKDKLAAKILYHQNIQDPDSVQTNQQNSTTNKSGSNSNSGYSLFSVRHKDIYINTNIAGKSLVEKVFSAGKKFSDLKIHKYLVSNLEKNLFTNLTNVQEKSIPVIMEGKNVLVRSQTGSGKTLAYAVPILDALQNLNPRLQRSDGVQALIVVPTRELALQTNEIFGKINTFQWIVVSHLCGGENRNTEKNRLRKGVHILIGTPGRLLDHILHTTALKINQVRCLVLDEADRLLDMGFKKDIVKIVEELDSAKTNAKYDPMAMLKRPQSKKFDDNDEDDQPKIDADIDPDDDDASPLKNPKSSKRQTVLLSATLNKGIAELADFLMKDHVYVDGLDNTANINPEHMVIPNTVKQEFIMTYVKHKLFTLSATLIAKSKHKVFVFMATGQMVDFHYELFTQCLVKMPRNRGKLKSGEILLLEDEGFEDSDDEEEVVLDTQFYKLHGSMDQSERKRVFTSFRAAKKGILLCTDVAARGVDVPEADCIIQYTGPQSDDDYIHRVGRTGRAGKSGTSVIFLTHEEQEFVTRLQEHKVFLKKQDPTEYLKHLCDLMEEPDHERAATALQRRYESAVEKDEELHRMACFAYSSWSRFYNTYPGKLRGIFNFKDVNLGHYVTSFALKETPSSVARMVRGQMPTVQPRRLNKKLATHSDDQQVKAKPTPKRKIKSISLTTSEFSSGLEPSKKKKKKKN